MEKRKKENRWQNKFQHRCFILHKILQPSVGDTKFEDFGSHRS